MFLYILSNLILILCILCPLGSVLFNVGNRGGDFYKRISNITFFVILLDFLLLIYAHVSGKFYISSVYFNTSIMTPLYYKISSSWGSHEGSLLLWLLILSLYGVLFNLFYKINGEILKLVNISQCLIISVFSVFIFILSNPFDMVCPAPNDGLGFNPVLQDVAVLIHPPFLYMGYVGTSILFAITVAVILTDKLDDLYFRAVKFFGLFALFFLTIGIALGAWWAYRELGWGGFWFWDPVENISIIPWFLLLSIIHITILVKYEKGMVNFLIAQCLFIFPIALSGTFFVRSGIISSVHSFAEDSSRGMYMLAILFIITLFSIFLFFGKKLPIYNIELSKTAQRKSLMLFSGSVAMVFSSFVLLVAIICPFIFEAITGEIIYIEDNYYSSIFSYISSVAVILMFFAPYMGWNEALFIKNFYKKILVIIVSFVISFYFVEEISLIFKIILSFSVAILLYSLFYIFISKKGLKIRSMSSVLSHSGAAVLLIGVLLSTSMSVENLYNLNVGERFDFMDYSIKFSHIRPLKGDNYSSVRAGFDIYRNNKLVCTAYPEVRFYIAEGVRGYESWTCRDFAKDIQVILGDYNKDTDRFLVRFHYKPFVIFVWMGAILISVGILLSLYHRKKIITNPV